MSPALDDDPEDPVPLERRPGLFGALARHRRLLFVAGMVWFAVVLGGTVMITSIEARYGMHVFGTQKWVAGEPAVLRAALRDLRFTGHEPLGPLSVQLVDAEGNPGPVQRLADPAGVFVQGALVAPGRPGTWQARIDAEGPDGPVSAQFAVEVAPTAPTFTWPAPPKAKHPPKPDQGPLKLDVKPIDHVLPGGLPGTLVVRAADADGKPMSTEVSLKTTLGRSGKPIPSSVITDRHGLATVDVLPMHPVFDFEVTAGAAPTAVQPADGQPPEEIATTPDTRTTAYRRVHHTNTQFALTVTEPVIAPGASIEAHIRSIHGDDDVFVDVWHGDRWLATASTRLEQGAASVEIPLPALPADPTVVWVQVLQNTYQPGDARAGRHLVVSRKAIPELIRWVAEALADKGYAPATMRAHAADADGSRRLLRDLLGRLPRPTAEPPLLADSGETSKQTVALLKSVWQGRMVLALALSGAVIFVILAVLIVVNQRQVQRGWIEAGGAEEGELLGTRKRLLVDAGYMFLVLAFFLIGVIQLLMHIHW